MEKGITLFLFILALQAWGGGLCPIKESDSP